MERYLMTASLLNSWQYYINSDYGTYDDFLKTLNREPNKTTKAQELGNEFEAWAVKNYTPTLNGCYQVKAYRDYKNYLLYGRIDCLKAGIIYDYKHTSEYDVGKFFGRPQTAMYFELVPEADKFIYVIGKGIKQDKWNEEDLFTEIYRRDEIKPVGLIIDEFEEWLKIMKLYNIYKEKWKCK